MSMVLWPVASALFVWWFATGLIVVLDHLPQASFRWSMLGATLLAGYGFHVLASVGADTTVHGAYVGFLCAIAIWAWQEMSFLMGFITGPSRRPCPLGVRGFARFMHGVSVVIYHEAAIVAGGVAIWAISLGDANRTALWTYLILWGMRVSAKLNLFAGVRNVSERFLPPHLAYLGGFFHQRPMNALMPISISLGSVLGVILVQRAGSPDAGAYLTTQYVLLATMVILGVIEHWFLVVPVPFEELWSWYLRARSKAPPLPMIAASDPVSAGPSPQLNAS